MAQSQPVVMPNLNLVSTQYTAPGVYLTEKPSEVRNPTIASFSAVYLFGEVSSSVSISLSTGIPFNVPVLISSLQDFEERLSGGNSRGFIRPASGSFLTTYNAIKLFFRNTASSNGASLYFIRVKPVDSVAFTVEEEPSVYTSTDESGVENQIYAYRVTINGYNLGRTEYNSQGLEVYYGVEVPAGSDYTNSRNAIAQALLNSPVANEVVLQNYDGSSYSDLNDSENTTANSSFLISPKSALDSLNINGYDILDIINSNSPLSLQGTSYWKGFINDQTTLAKASDYVYSIESVIDPTVFPPGFLIAPPAFAKFNPEDRLKVGRALENLASNIDYAYMALVDCGNSDGREIAKHYNYPNFTFHDSEPGNYFDALNRLGRPVFIEVLNQFYQLTDYAYNEYNNPNGLTTDNTYHFIDGTEINLPDSFVGEVTIPTLDDLLYPGTVLNIDGGYYVVEQQFLPQVLPIELSDPIGDGSNKSKYLRRAKLLIKVPEYNASNAVNGRDGSSIPQVNYTYYPGEILKGHNSGTTYVQGSTSSQDYVMVLSEFTVTSLPLAANNPNISHFRHGVAKGELVAFNGKTYYCTKNSQIYLADFLSPNSQNTVPSYLKLLIPKSYYQEWVNVNIRANFIEECSYSPIQGSANQAGARNIVFNPNSHEDLANEHLMYSSALGYLAYYAPYVIDVDGYPNPPSSAVAGTALRSFRERGFFEPIGGVSYPLKGVLRPDITITRSHQQSSNPTGLNAIREMPFQGTVVWGARTRSRNKLFRWINTRIILNVVINSLRNSFDDKLFRSIDGVQTMFREIRSTAENILYRLYSIGALYGSNPSEAYKVVCNETNNNNFTVEDGVVNVQIFVVPVSTLEIISITITRSPIGSLNVSTAVVGENN